MSVYPDSVGLRWWTKAWFNGRQKGEPSVAIKQETAVSFMDDRISKDEMLEKYFPKQMEIYHNVMEQTREQIISQLSI